MDSHGKLEVGDVPDAPVDLTAALENPSYAGSALVQEAARGQQRDTAVGTVAPLATDIMVDPAKLLDAAKIIQKVLEDTRPQIERKLETLLVEAPGMDPVSTESARLWNEALVADEDSFTNRVREYLDGLQTLVLNLVESARGYGYRDEDVQTVLAGIAAARPTI